MLAVSTFENEIPMITSPLVLTLGEHEKSLLENLLYDIRYPSNSFAEYVRSIRLKTLLSRNLFSRLFNFVDEQVRLENRPCAIKIENLPIDKNPPVPSPGASFQKHILKETYLSENILTLIANLFGYPYSMHYEGQGLVNNLIPNIETSKDITGLGATSDLRFHIENAALRFLNGGRDCSPKALFLIGVRQDEHPPKTRLSDVRLALKLISSETRAVLEAENYKIKLPYRWRDQNQAYASAETAYIPLLQSTPSGLTAHAAFYGDMIIDMRTNAAGAAAKEFEAALEEVAVDEIVSPGVLLGIDNRITLHARTPFKATFDELGRAQRWVQRIFVTSSLDNFTDWLQTDTNIFAPKENSLC